MKSFKERLEEAYDFARRKEPNLNKREIAASLGVTPGAVSSWFTGRNGIMSADIMLKLANRLGVNFQWLSSGEGYMYESYSSNKIETVDGDENQIRIACTLSIQGANGLHIDAIDEELFNSGLAISLPSSWFERNQIKASDCRVVLASGDSMSPLINDGDLVLVDTAITNIVDGFVYLIQFEDYLMIKTLRRISPYQIVVESFNNPDLYEFILDTELQDNLVVIGKVVYRSGKI